MHREEGVGLAAPQIGVLSRVMVWRHPENEDEEYVFVNPRDRRALGAVHHGGARAVCRCPGCTMEVERADEVVVERSGSEGQPVPDRGLPGWWPASCSTRSTTSMAV